MHENTTASLQTFFTLTLDPKINTYSKAITTNHISKCSMLFMQQLKSMLF